ncbi:MAG: hypothetical protein Q8876_04590 [Bacillota bacterium]|nr:hypothetical protein [Bacillota bacterium]
MNQNIKDSNKKLKGAPLFLRIFTSKFKTILKTNLLFICPFIIVNAILFCITVFLQIRNPVAFFVIWFLQVPILSPFWYGVCGITKNLVAQKPVVSVYNIYKTYVIENLKQSLINGIILYVLLTVESIALLTYFFKALSQPSMWAIFAVSVVIFVFILFFSCYIPVMTVSYKLKSSDILKNSALMSAFEFKTNLIFLFAFIIFIILNAALSILAVIAFLLYFPTAFALIINMNFQPKMAQMLDIEKPKEEIKKNAAPLANITASNKQTENASDEYIFHEGKMIKLSVLLAQAENQEDKQNEEE